MANITLYLPDDIEAKVRKAAAGDGLPVSRWISDRLAQIVDSSWPADFLNLAGAFPDLPEPEDLRSGYGADAPREPLA